MLARRFGFIVEKPWLRSDPEDAGRRSQPLHQFHEIGVLGQNARLCQTGGGENLRVFASRRPKSRTLRAG